MTMCTCFIYVALYIGIYIGKMYEIRTSSNTNDDHSIHLFLSKASYLSSGEISFAIYINETYWGWTKSSEVTISGLEKDVVYSIEADVYINKQILRGLKVLTKTTSFRKKCCGIHSTSINIYILANHMYIHIYTQLKDALRRLIALSWCKGYMKLFPSWMSRR